MSRTLAVFLLLLTIPATVFADGDSAQANNPIANMTALSFHEYYIGEFTGVDKDGNQFWLRYAQPFSIGESDWLLRASLPVNSYPFEADGSTETGLGDVNIIAPYLIDTGKPGLSLGIGPQLNIPTATDKVLGSEKWSTGAAAIVFDASSKVLQWGGLTTYAISFAGDSDRDDVNLASAQPFIFFQLGRGLYLRSSAVMAFNFENGDYTIPAGFGVGQVIPQGNTVYNFFVEPQYSIFDEGATWPEWQIFVGFNMQFKSDAT
ncbi:MAG: hypothetical protein KDD66_15670 [Bdellovibrionales bacterium]|nr:hypothetical protein [Bdellovibrionales bacterium]